MFDWRIGIWRQPTDQLRDYFGERLGFYFFFISFYTAALGWCSIVSIVIGILHLLYGNETWGIVLLCTYAIFIMAWSAIFMEMWKRKVAVLWHTHTEGPTCIDHAANNALN